MFKTSIKFDPDKLLQSFEEMRKCIPATNYNGLQSGKRTGWALTSRTGGFDDIHGRRYRPYTVETEFTHPTPALSGYLKDVVDELQANLGELYRARIVRIRGKRSIKPHHDGHDGTKFFRYHIPIIPNPRCTFHSDGHDFVMSEAGRLYLFPAWKIHAVENAGGERVHLLFSAYRHVDMPDAEVNWPMEATLNEV
jgi:hypothetical protein